MYRDHYLTAQVDESLRHCKARPTPTKPVEQYDSKDTSNALVDFADYGDDCAAKLAAVWKTLDDAELKAAQQNKDASNAPAH